MSPAEKTTHDEVHEKLAWALTYNERASFSVEECALLHEVLEVATLGHRHATAVGPRRFKHDCDVCQFLGAYGETDLYVCARNGVADTVIARRSDDGPDYSSGLAFAHSRAIPELAEAKRRAEAIGIDCSRAS